MLWGTGGLQVNVILNHRLPIHMLTIEPRGPHTVGRLPGPLRYTRCTCAFNQPHHLINLPHNPTLIYVKNQNGLKSTTHYGPKTVSCQRFLSWPRYLVVQSQNKKIFKI